MALVEDTASSPIAYGSRDQLHGVSRRSSLSRWPARVNKEVVEHYHLLVINSPGVDRNQDYEGLIGTGFAPMRRGEERKSLVDVELFWRPS